MNLSRIELADYGSLDEIAKVIVRQLPDLTIPVPIEKIARQLDILDIRALETEGFEGGLLTDKEKSEGIILFKQSSPRQRRRFTIGHELGHFLSPWHRPKEDRGCVCSSDDMIRSFAKKGDKLAEMEVQANRFSALMLMPSAHFQKDLKRKAGVDIQHVIDLARRYETSKESTARRYVELHGERSAVVVSHNGSVLRIYRHPDFPFIDVLAGHPIPRQSHTARGDIPSGEPTDCEEIDGGIWFQTRRGCRAPTLYEQVLRQQNGYRMTMLSFDEDEIENQQEEEDLRRSWTPRFHRK